MKIAIQGIRGSFHDQAAQNFFTDNNVANLELAECKSFREVFDSVNTGNADYGMVAVENSLHGPINPVYTLLAEHNMWVCGEIRIHVEMCLIAGSAEPSNKNDHTEDTVNSAISKMKDSTDLDQKFLEITSLNVPGTTVMSHFAAFGQCERWLAKNLPNAKYLEIEDTAEAVKRITNHQTTSISPDDIMAESDSRDATQESTHTQLAIASPRTQLAIASRYASELYGGTLLAENINDNPENYTRFFVIQKEKPAEIEEPFASQVGSEDSGTSWKSLKSANRTSVILREPSADKPGSLYEVLGIFAKYNINLSKIDSHPMPGKVRRYSFYIDFDAGPLNPSYVSALEEIKNHNWNIQILGSYNSN